MRLRLKTHLPILLLTGAALAILPSYVWAYSLSGASETPTIVPGDTFIVNRAAYCLRLPFSRVTLLNFDSPRRGDIVQAQLPAGIGTGIKRVLGLPGETIEVRENLVIVNGRPLATRELAGPTFAWVPAAARMGSTVAMEDGHWVAYTLGKSRYRSSPPVRLRASEYFLMGDNRDNSFDSRAFGPVSGGQITGKVTAVLPKDHRPIWLGRP
jgi:signal peptidase I